MALFVCRLTVMTANTDADRDPERLAEALRLVVRRYVRQVLRRPAISVPALLMPGIGEVLVFYAPPLVIAKLLGAFYFLAIEGANHVLFFHACFAGR